MWCHKGQTKELIDRMGLRAKMRTVGMVRAGLLVASNSWECACTQSVSDSDSDSVWGGRAWAGLCGPAATPARGTGRGSVEQVAFELGPGQWVEIEQGCNGEFLQAEGAAQLWAVL